MPHVPAVSPATQKPVPDHFIHVGHGSFLDNNGRTLILRGVNLSGADKAPVGHPSYELEGFWEEGESGGGSFVGRPLNLEDGSADVHLARLRGWGFNVIRYVVTWEALEHSGPRKYDTEFMDYTVQVLRKIKEYGFKVFMDPHQDIWSRFSGGSGAPYWTLAACGLNPRNFSAGLSAIIHSEYPLPNAPDPSTLPAMIWSTNYARLISQTVFTLFFAGRTFAPKCVIDGVNIQDYLQSHFIAAFGLLADRIRDAGDLLDECVYAWDSMNEPGEGFCGLEDLNQLPAHQALKKGPTPTPIQGLRLGMGQTQTVDNWNFGAMGPSRSGTVTINPAKRKVWAEPNTEPGGVHPKWGWKRDKGWKLGEDVWAQHGVWCPESGNALVPDYFAYLPGCGGQDEGSSSLAGEKVIFVADFWRPFWRTYAKRIRESHPEAIIFVQPPVFVAPPPLEEEDLKGRAAYSAHYYDGLTLMTRHWNWFNADALGLLRGKYKTTVQALKLGSRQIRQSFRDQLGMLKDDATTMMGVQYPTLIGEIGIPMDMDGKRAYGWTDDGRYRGNYSEHVKALDASLNGADGPNGLNYTLWTYVPDGNHQWGDGWNMEDLSLWCADDLRQPAAGPSLGMSPSATYITPSSSRAQLLRANSRSRTSSTSSGPDGEPRDSHAVYATTVKRPPPPPVNDSSVSLGSIVTLSMNENDTRLRPRLPGGPSVKFGDAQCNGVKFNVQAPSPRTESPSPSARGLGLDSNPFGFLTDGARAVAAFARPFPTATLGTPKTIDFDLQKAMFKLVVTVCPEDAPGKKFVAGEEVTTEIFVPLVHFASDPWAKDYDVHTLGDSVPGGWPPEESDAYGEEVAQQGGVAPESNNSFLASSLTLGRSRSSTGLESPYTPTIPTEAYSIGVELSEGSWRLDSQKQTLYWKYQIPAPGEPAVERTIQIWREGGVIKSVADGTVTQNVDKQRIDAAAAGMWDCCPSDGCTIM
ncbi:hypothetical protein FRB94_004657 [Tulasnella sp. JGI-2019a]|nr:hypothetical protein FRB94_004657 [Tulasnella sp. JGI-2019a]